MAFTTRTSQGVNADINMIPLIDVMLVLLIVFMVTAPLMTYSVRIRLPTTAAPAHTAPPEAIRVGIDPQGQLSWNQQPIEEAALAARLAEAARREPQPPLHLYADRKTAYEPIARVMALAARSGLNKLGFESLPEQEAAGATP